MMSPVEVEQLVQSLARLDYGKRVAAGSSYLPRLFYQVREVQPPLPADLRPELDRFVGSLIVEEAGRMYSTIRVVPFNGRFFVVDSYALASTGGLEQYHSHKPGMYGLVGGDGMMLARYILSQVNDRQFERGLDLCTGSGVVGISICALFETMQGVDIEEASVPWARLNARINQVSNFSCMHGDLYEPVRGSGPYDVITANPSYAFYPEEYKEEYQIREHEVGADYGLELVFRIIDGYEEFLADGGIGYICTLVPMLDGRDYLVDQLREKYSSRDYQFEVCYNHSVRNDARLESYYASLGISRLYFVYIKTVKGSPFQVRQVYSSLYYLSKIPIPRRIPNSIKRLIKKILPI